MMHRILNSLLLLMVLVFLPITAGAKTYLVSVGISNYPGSSSDLRVSHNDAATIQWVYEENKDAETILLMNEQATVKKVKSSMKKLFSKSTKDDTIVFFFSGNGVKGAFVCYDGYLYYHELCSMITSYKSECKLVFADASYAGAIRDNRKVSSEYNSVNNNIMFFMSCRSDENSFEGKNISNGIFTYALQHGLRGNADTNKNRVVTALELFSYVSAEVKKMSNNHQHPVMWGKYPDSMPVIKWWK